jgi:hypothetical protein
MPVEAKVAQNVTILVDVDTGVDFDMGGRVGHIGCKTTMIVVVLMMVMVVDAARGRGSVGCGGAFCDGC